MKAAHTYENWGPHDDACITCELGLGGTLEHFPDMLVDAGHAWSCRGFCRKCRQHDGDCGEEHRCDSLEHWVR